MPSHPALRWLVAATLVVAAACSGQPKDAATGPAGERIFRTAPTPTPTPTPAEPFSIDLGDVHIMDSHNAVLLSAAPPGVDEAAAHTAVEDAAERLRVYLDAQFTDPSTWFSAEPLGALLTPGAEDGLSDEARSALGVLDLDVGTVETGPAEVRPMVTMLEATALNVTLSFTASLVVVLADGSQVGLRQHGDAAFVPVEDGWRAEAVDVTLEQAADDEADEREADE